MKTICSLMLGCFLAAGSVPAQETVLLRAAHARTGTGRTFTPATILVKDNLIAAVGTDLEAPEGALVLDLGNVVLTPGLVDGLSYAGLPLGIADNEQTSEVTPLHRASEALDARKEDLVWLRQQGVTSLVVHPGSKNVIGGLVCHIKPRGTERAEVLITDRIALRITLGPDTANGNRGIGFGTPSMFSRIPNSRMGAIYLVRNAFQEALNYRDLRGRDPNTPVDAEKEVLLEALDGKLPVFWQARGAMDIQGAANLIREFGIKKNVIVDAWEAEHALEDIVSLGLPILLGPLVHAQYHWGARRGEARRHSVSGAAKLARAGIKAGFSHCGFQSGGTLIDSARFAVRAGLPAAEALAWVTSRPARILGLDARVGALEQGKDADIVAWSGDPLLPTSAVNWVMIDGRVTFKKTGDEPKGANKEMEK